MKELLILSGKGGTGKTTLASAFIKLSQVKAYADCDVDAPNLHLVMKLDKEPLRSDYFGLKKAFINQERCKHCGLCQNYCRFEAISFDRVNIHACEGCGVCELVCPTGAITLKDNIAGELMLYQNEVIFSTAQLKMGNGTSGLLVTEVKKEMKKHANEVKFAIIDGSPGIGCPVIASISGVSMIVIVTEPSLSGISDMERIIETAKKFHVKIAVCINKFDTNKMLTQKIESTCKKKSIPVIGKIPYDKAVIKAVNDGKSIVDIDCIAKDAITNIYYKTLDLLFE